MNINDLLTIAVERKASDLHLKVGSHPVIRVDGQLHSLPNVKRLMQEDTVAMGFSMMNARQKQRFKEDLGIDIAYSVPGLGRFRVNVFQQRGSVSLVARVIPSSILTFKELTLPPVLETICEQRRLRQGMFGLRPSVRQIIQIIDMPEHMPRVLRAAEPGEALSELRG